MDPLTATCPLPQTETERVLLGHGSGGRLREPRTDLPETAEAYPSVRSRYALSRRQASAAGARFVSGLRSTHSQNPWSTGS